MILLREVKALCREYNIKPLRRRGQNFLINNLVIKKVLEAADLKKQDVVLEIGAGLGTLTKEIARKVKKVIAVEIDKELVKALKNELKGYKNVEIVQEDIRNNRLIVKLLNCYPEYKVVANLPFNITGLVLRQFLAGENKPQSMVLILQKEAGERIVARPPKMSRLALTIQFYGQAKIIAQVKKDNFWPKPKVDSTILRIVPTNYPRPVLERTEGESDTNINEDRFFQIIRAGFSSPRKYLLNNLAKSGIMGTVPEWGLSPKETVRQVFKQIGLSPKVRAQELSVEEWIKLAETLEHENMRT